MTEENLFEVGTGLGDAWNPAIRVRLLSVQGKNLMEFMDGTRSANSLWELPEILTCGSESEEWHPALRRDRWFAIRHELVTCPKCNGSQDLQCEDCNDSRTIRIKRLIFRKPLPDANGDARAFDDDDRLTQRVADSMAHANSSTMQPINLEPRLATRSLVERIFRTPKIRVQKSNASTDQFIIRFSDIYAPTEKVIKELRGLLTPAQLQKLLATYLLEKSSLPSKECDAIFYAYAIRGSARPKEKTKSRHLSWFVQLEHVSGKDHTAGKIADALVKRGALRLNAWKTLEEHM